MVLKNNNYLCSIGTKGYNKWSFWTHKRIIEANVLWVLKMVQGFVEVADNGKKFKKIFHHEFFLLVNIWNQNDAALS